jgi:hypothetical protein
VFADEGSCVHCGASTHRALVAVAVAASLGVAACSDPPVVAVYGPAPVTPSVRTSAEPTPTPTATPTGSASAAPQPPAPVYGPPPQSSTQRLEGSDSKKPPAIGVYGPAPAKPGQRTPGDPLE